MKKTFKKALSIVLSLALTITCLTCAFVSASAETTTTPEKMLKITPQVAGDAVSFRQQNLVAGHTYKLKMLQKGITSVIPFSTDWSTYTNTPAVAGTEGDYTTYTFTCVYGRTRLLFTTEAAGISGYMADIKLFDVTSNEYVEISFTDMTFVYGTDTYSNWLVDRPDVTAYSSDILNADIANINFIELLDFDEKYFLNLGDYNGDGLVDIRDLVYLKKFTVGLHETVNEKALISDGDSSLELVCARKLLLGFSYAQIKEQLYPF